MMLAIEIRFPAGRFHATPWDRQVNEGVVEWPPSPWRILRALIATWHHKAKGDVDEGVVRGLVDKLSALPTFSLPPAALGHTRHYMPLFRSGIDGKTVKVFDTFACIEAGKGIAVVWSDVDLDEREHQAMEMLLSRLGYIGRAESWAEAKLIEGAEIRGESRPIREGESLKDGFEGVRTLACLNHSDYSLWREQSVSQESERRLLALRAKARDKGKPEGEEKLSMRDIKEIEGAFPSDLFEALQADTSDLKSAGWSQPPGSVWVTYARRRDCFEIMPRGSVGSMRATDGLPDTARFAVSSQAPPRFTEALSLAERIHTSAVSRSAGSTVFTGCDGSHNPLEGHKHAYILPESNLGAGRGRRGEITHVTIYAPMGFDASERAAIDGLTEVWGHGGHDIQLTLLGVGERKDFAGLDKELGECPILASATTWISRTPFVPTRHPKMRKNGEAKVDENGLQIGGPEHELRRLLRLGGFPDPIAIESVVSIDLAGHETRWMSFRTERSRGEGRRASRGLGYGFRILFPQKVNGPIALGYGAHFGLGQFVPDEKDISTI